MVDDCVIDDKLDEYEDELSGVFSGLALRSFWRGVKFGVSRWFWERCGMLECSNKLDGQLEGRVEGWDL